MDTQQNNSISLSSIPANRQLIEALFSRKLISADAREYGLQLLYPSKNWGSWASKLLLVISISLILSAIIYFFAFNWTKITPGLKLGSIQVAILGCLVTSYFYGLLHLSGKILLLSASVLVGVFLAVFGQIYQTGADSYNLFMMWAILTLPWAVISELAALWIIWLVISNIALVLFWTQVVLPGYGMEETITSYLILFNGVFLGLREYFLTKKAYWLQGQWTRIVLIIAILIYAFIPTITFILAPSKATYSVIFGSVLSLVVHMIFYIIYRFKLPNMWGLAVTILSGSIILELAIFRALIKINYGDAIMFLLMCGTTLIVFTFAITKLRVIAKEMEKKHV